LRKALVPTIAALLLAVAAVALANNAGDADSENDSSAAVNTSVPSCTNPPSPDAPPETVEFMRAYCAGELEPPGPNDPTSFISDEPIPQNILDNCERDADENGGLSRTCEVVQAIASGDIPPGEYTDEEMNEMLRSSSASR
jgi:hypothetical protein